MKYIFIFIFLLPVSSYALGDWFGEDETVQTEAEAVAHAANLPSGECKSFLRAFYEDYYGKGSEVLIFTKTSEACSK